MSLITRPAQSGGDGDFDHGKGDQAKSNTILSVPNLQFDLTQIVIKREEQRNHLLEQVFCLGLIIVSVMYVAAILFVFCAFSQITKLNGNFVEGLQALGNLWHIILILFLTPTTILGIMLRSMSFQVNAAEIGGKHTNSEENSPIGTIAEIHKQLKELIELIRK